MGTYPCFPVIKNRRRQLHERSATGSKWGLFSSSSDSILLLYDKGRNKGIGMLKLGWMHRQTGEKFVDPTAMSRQMREVSDF